VIRGIAIAASLFVSALAAQNSDQGVTAAWDVRTQIRTQIAHIKDLEALLRKAEPKMWEDNGAPEAYVSQLRSAHSSMGQLVAAADTLSRDPEKLQPALETYFQMERIQFLLGSLRDAIRKYQSPELADRLAQLLAQTALDRERLKQQIRDIAAEREQEFQIVNEEAQRCRGTLVKETPAPTSKKRATSPAESSTSKSK
jgi:hypothetical protein